MTRRFLLIPHLKIHNANAISSPFTIGFPAITAWLGATHALQRKLNDNGFENVIFNAVAISCHKINLQTHKDVGDYVYSIIGTANPLDKDGKRPSFIEEARCHIEVSLLIEYQGLNADDTEKFKKFIDLQLLIMKFAGGDVLSVKKVDNFIIDEDDESSFNSGKNKLMLGHVIIERNDLIKKTMEDENKDALESLLDYIKINHQPTVDKTTEEVSWEISKKEAGWLVPIAVGFQGISELGSAKNQRDSNFPHRFAESIVTLGEFIMPCRIKKLDDMLWQYHVDGDLYLCKTLSNLTKKGE